MKHKHGAVSPNQERRFTSGSRLEVRRKDDGSPSTIVGYASVFAPAMSDDLGGFREQIHRNAFDECLASDPDVRGLWNHDPNHVLGRSKSGTLRLSTDSRGLRYEIDLPDTQTARDLATSIDRGDVDQSSFGFICNNDSWREENGQYIRTVLKASVFDVSPVTFPAYPYATAGVRGALRSAPAAIREKIAGVLKRATDADACEEYPDSPDCKGRKKRDRIDELCDDLDPDDEEYEELDCDERKKRAIDNGETVDDPSGTSGECDCDCDACPDNCEECSNTRCTRSSCSLCPAQQRSATVDLLIRRLRF